MCLVLMKQGLCLQIVLSKDIRHRKINCPCEAARVNTMTGSLDPSFGFPPNGKIPYPPSGNLEPASQYAPSKKQRES